ncbi:PAAR domain-containing protein [Luteimonas sp. MJ250]|uniref:PAAR domain-containing protein n=1 Tax=Luteimonas sp. MJ250 TaxID=3129236 RepID=UPI0031BBAF20
MARIWIVVGDATTHGGRVLGGSPFTSIEGKSVARMGDAVACPKCGPTTIVSGDATIVVDGQPLARHGDSTTCGATLIAGSQVRAFIDSGAAAGSGAGGTAVAAASAVAVASAVAAMLAYDEAFVLRSAATGKALANRGYRIICASGRTEEGVTDAEGRTAVVTSDATEALRIELEEEGP